MTQEHPGWASTSPGYVMSHNTPLKSPRATAQLLTCHHYAKYFKHHIIHFPVPPTKVCGGVCSATLGGPCSAPCYNHRKDLKVDLHFSLACPGKRNICSCLSMGSCRTETEAMKQSGRAEALSIQVQGSSIVLPDCSGFGLVATLGSCLIAQHHHDEAMSLPS